MKYLSLLFLFLVFSSCKKDAPVIAPQSYLNAEEQQNFKDSIIRYVDHLAKLATHQTKFNTIFDEEYKIKSAKSDLLYYYVDKSTNLHYFALTKIAPSLKAKRVAIVGKLEFDKNGGILLYEEGFRTWKMEQTELETKTKLLFLKYIEGEDLTPFYAANSNGELYIEFPDKNTSYNKKTRLWETK